MDIGIPIFLTETKKVKVETTDGNGDKIEDEELPHHFLHSLPPRFETIATIIVREGLKNVTPTQVLGDIMANDAYRVEKEGATKEAKKEKKEEKKSVDGKYVIKIPSQNTVNRPQNQEIHT